MKMDLRATAGGRTGQELPLSYSFTVGQPNQKGGRTVLHASIEMEIREVKGSIWFTSSHHAPKERVIYCSATISHQAYGLIFQALSQNKKPTLRLATWRLLSLIQHTLTSDQEVAEFANWMQAIIAIPEYQIYERLDRAAKSTHGVADPSWRALVNHLIGAAAD